MLSNDERDLIILALSQATEQGSLAQRREWQATLDRFIEENPEQTTSASCHCEDRPCCGCEADVYQPAYDPHDPNNYDPEKYFG
jgi:hypothetical protein